MNIRWNQNFSLDNLDTRTQLIHDIGHVWEHQNIDLFHYTPDKCNEQSDFLRNAGLNPYDYVLNKNKGVHEHYGFEAQAQIPADYFLMRNGSNPWYAVPGTQGTQNDYLKSLSITIDLINKLRSGGGIH